MGEPQKMPTRSQLAAVVSGNALEFYDFLSFGFFAVNLARVMFPAGQPGTSLLLTLMTGSLGFFARPVGAIVFGILGDRIGRRPTMLTTFGLMGASALGLALTPSYAQIGIAAPILVVIFRLLQGLSAGGDVGPTTAFLAESAPMHRRGLFICLQLVAMRLGAFSSGLIGLLLASNLSPAELDSYGWRLAFGIGAAIVPLAFALRRRLEETLHWEETGPHAVTSVSPWLYAATLMGVLGFLTGNGAGDFIFVYAVNWLKVPSSVGYMLTITIGAIQVMTLMVGSALSDRFGRRPVKIGAGMVGALAAIPLFRWVASGATMVELAPAVIVLTIAMAIGASAAYPTFVETTPKRIRSGLIGIGYGMIVALAFGLTPILITQYINATGDLSGPGYAWLFGGALLLLSGILVPETSARHVAARATA
jgi:MFS family permease